MGDWAIVINGTGAHHNKDYPTDADRMAQKFVDDLVVAGHQIALATFTSGGRTVLDTSDNVEAKNAESAYYRDDPDHMEQLRQGTERRRESLRYVGLGESKRKDPPLGMQTAEILSPSQK